MDAIARFLRTLLKTDNSRYITPLRNIIGERNKFSEETGDAALRQCLSAICGSIDIQL